MMVSVVCVAIMARCDLRDQEEEWKTEGVGGCAGNGKWTVARAVSGDGA